MTQMDMMDITAANMKNTVMTLTERILVWVMIGIGISEPLARAPAVNMRPHTAPQSPVKVRVIRQINFKILFFEASFYYISIYTK